MELVTADGRRYTLKRGSNVVGRSMDSGIPVDEGSLSRRHADLQWDGRQCLVVDLGSTNGTFLENHRVPPGQPTVVQPGMELRFGPNLCANLEPGQFQAATAYASPAVGRPGSQQAVHRGGFDLFFQAFDVALDLHKLAVAFAGLLLSMIVGAFFLWVMSQAAEVSDALAIATAIVGAVAVWLLFTFTTGTISRLVLVELTEGRREGVRAAMRYTAQHLLAFLLSPLLLLLGIVLVVVLEGILMLVGRIETVGEIVVALAFLPAVLLNLGLLVVAMFGTTLTFPIVADRGGSVGDTLSRVLRFVRRLPARLIAYTLLAAIVSLFVFLAVFYLVTAASFGTSLLAEMGMEPFKFMDVFVGLSLDPDELASGLLLGGLGGFGYDPPASYRIAQVIFALTSSALVLATVTIPQLFYLSSACAVYLNLRQDLPEPNPAGPAWQSRRGSGAAAKQEYVTDQKLCWSCGSALAYDQTYCPHCGQMQR